VKTEPKGKKFKILHAFIISSTKSTYSTHRNLRDFNILTNVLVGEKPLSRELNFNTSRNLKDETPCTYSDVST